MQPLHIQPLAVVALAVIAIAYYVLIYRPSLALPQLTVTLDDVPRIFQLLETSATDGAFAAFLFGANGQPPAQDEALNVQFSIAERRVGLDWPLLSTLNVEAEDRVAAFLGAHAHAPQRLEGDGGPYLRVEDGDLVRLCQQLLTDVFRVTRTQKIELIADGFEWPA